MLVGEENGVDRRQIRGGDRRARQLDGARSPAELVLPPGRVERRVRRSRQPSNWISTVGPPMWVIRMSEWSRPRGSSARPPTRGRRRRPPPSRPGPGSGSGPGSPVLGRRRRVILLLEVRLVDGRRADPVLGTGDEQQRRPRRVLVVDLRHRLRVEVRETGLEERTRRTRDVVTLVDRVRLFPLSAFVKHQWNCSSVSGAPSSDSPGCPGRARGPERRKREPQDTLGSTRAERDGGRAQATIERGVA